MKLKSIWSMVAMLWIFTFMFMLQAVTVLAQSASPSPSPFAGVQDQDINALVQAIFSDLASGKVVAAVAASVLICTFLFRKYFVDTGKVGSGSLPWISVLLSVLFGLASSLFLGASPAAAASAILLSGPIAGQVWSQVLKLVLKRA